MSLAAPDLVAPVVAFPRLAPGVAMIASALGVDLVERDELDPAAGRYGAPLPPSLVP